MKRIRIIEILANIKANLVAFLSIAMFVCLGVGLFLGIQWGAVALRNASLESMNAGNLNDISVQFPYGITESDLSQIKDIEGVSKIEPGYSSYVVMEDGSTAYTLKVQSVPQEINTPISIRGNMPKEKNEIALLANFADEHHIGVGDKITLKHDATEQFNEDGTTTTDPDGMQFLNTDTYTVTALVNSAEYLYKNPQALGVCNIGSGQVDCVGYITNESFDTSKYNDGYPNVYIRCDSLNGLSVFENEYQTKALSIADKITELGGTLGTARYNKLHDDAQKKLDDAKKKIDDGEKQLEDGKNKIADGEKQLADGREKVDDGEKELVNGVVSGSAQQNAAQIKLQEGYRQLADGQAKYDAGVATYLQVTEIYNEILSAIGNIGQSDGNSSSTGKSSTSSGFSGNDEGSWLNRDENSTGTELGDGELLDSARSAIDDLSGAISDNGGSSGSGSSVVTDLFSALGTLGDKMSEAEATLEESKARLDAGWEEYYQAKAAYDAGVAEGQAKLIDGQQELDSGKETLKDKTQELEDGKKEIADKTKELQDGKNKYADAEKQFKDMVQYEWVVLPRQGLGSVMGLIMITSMMDNVKWAMALLFILVGLFVCYSAISRLVHEQIIQIGTKKALGFRQGEVMSGYLAFSGVSALLGVLVAVLLAVLIVQGIMNPKANAQFTMPPFGPYVGLLDTLIMGGLEILLILFATWFAIHGLLKRNARDLLAGESTANAKEHFYEHWAIWKRMSLFSQTVVNNCINDTRRVIGTLVGVIGCTALIVVAVTLAGNIMRSFDLHYNSVYKFDTLTFLDDASEKQADSVALALHNRGIDSAPAYTRKLQTRKDSGERSVVTLMVPTIEDAFDKKYHVLTTDGKPANINDGGLWISTAYADHRGVKVGDEVTLTEFSGKTHTFRVAGIFQYYLVRYEFVLSPNEYREAFGEKPQPNVLLTSLDGADIGRTRDALKEVDGYNSLVDDKSDASYSYTQINDIMRTVVIIYLVLSALMALMVLLNLDIMFVNEKKRELIVLMICGFSVKDAKAYIYRDSIVLTVIGILLGILFGAIMGGITVAALEPEMATWVKGFNLVAAVVGIVGAGAFSAAVLLYALRLIPRFDLTDINRF
ncbi:MAG: hypothetical protein IKF78_14590 [Atopobiaceae bacterium]|nr:hypothetical protein [Atopobiaceae bacterium]